MAEETKGVNTGVSLLEIKAMLTTVMSAQAEILSKLDQHPDASQWHAKLFEKTKHLMGKYYENLPGEPQS